MRGFIPRKHAHAASMEVLGSLYAQFSQQSGMTSKASLEVG